MKILFKELFNYKLSIFMILVATYLSTTFELLLPLLLANALNVGINQNYGLEYIKNIAIMMFALIAVSIILNIIISFLITRTSTYVSTNIRNKLFEKLLFLKGDDFKKFQISSLITRTNQDTEQIKNFISTTLSTIFKAPIILYSCIIVLINLNSKFFLLLFVAIVILVTFLIIIVIKLIPLSKKIQISIDNLNNHLKDQLTGYKIIKSYNNIEKENTKYKNENEKYLYISKKVIKISSIINPFLTLIVNTITIIVLFICINLVQINSMEAGTIIATIQYILQMLMAVLMLSMILLNFPSIKISLNRINEVINKETYSQNSEIKNFEIESISFDNVSFSYDNNTVLKNINISINKGENLGIIGLNGSGKSTLIKLLLKEKENFSGSIKINNTDLNSFSRKDITSNLTYVPQKPYLLKGSIIENIAFANNKLTLQDISKIIHCANLEKFISEKKENINYLIEEGGANLSGGQKQRISLARALAKESNLIILDEPFSALDYKTEKEIFTKLNNFYKEKSFVIISQRISSIINCNKIIVLDDGKIIDQGTHQELIERCSLYKDIYSLQKEAIEHDI